MPLSDGQRGRRPPLRRTFSQHLGPDDRRESTKARITLATVHTVAGEPCAEKFAAAALNGAQALHSMRVRSQLEPPETALSKRPTSTYTDLAHRAHTIRLAA